MSDLISRTEALKYIPSEDLISKMVIAQLPTIEPEPRWIPVTERLPEHKKTCYWICTDTGYQCECRWTDNRFGMGNLSGEWGWSIFDTPRYSKVVAWMPLPEPYKMDEVEE